MVELKRVPLVFGMLVLAFASSVTTLALRPVFADSIASNGTLHVGLQCVPINTGGPWQATLGFAGTHVVSVIRDGTEESNISGAGRACFEVFYQL
jgi:hypothetical protein